MFTDRQTNKLADIGENITFLAKIKIKISALAEGNQRQKQNTVEKRPINAIHFTQRCSPSFCVLLNDGYI